MLLNFCFFVFLIHGVKSGDKEIENCNREVGGRQRPTVDPSRCAHIDSPACIAIFPYDAGDIAATITSHFNPNENYKIPEKCTNADLKDFAEKNCPSHCAFCCKAKQFNCANDPFAGDHCDAFTLEMCRNAALNTIALMRCPMRCGLCDRPGAGGICPNTFDDAVCTALVAVICLDEKAKNSCQKTCGLRTCLENQNATAAQSNCRDDDQQCSENRKYCTIEPYATVMRGKCRLTCGHCQP
ncbi:unnamed protein product [Dracunculus medinensis]|uniref:ShKT domain-containing protein n=1 Tax=Dracunculus medinensis TaxID=318479 RepID=A0A0N4UQQ8_DRAME|nr:unnamed protein product [Dracunculus medinensis]